MLQGIIYFGKPGYIHTILKGTVMLEYAKIILPKVTFSRFLFKKELLKCIRWMTPGEMKELKRWCFNMFSHQYPDILQEAFAHQGA